MSVENRIFWLLVAILALWLVFSVAGRDAVSRFITFVFKGGGAPAGGGSATPPAQRLPDNPRDVFPGSGYAQA